MFNRRRLVRMRAAAVLATVSAALLAGALVALLIGWFWAGTRGDWQAIALWNYWFGAPVLSAVSIATGRGNVPLRRLNWALIGTWIAASALTLMLPFLG
jgi:hypothetical protein